MSAFHRDAEGPELRGTATSRDAETRADGTTRPPNILMVFPRFNPQTFWNLKEACGIWGAKCTAAPLGLITVAAMLPKGWPLRLVNRNAEDLTDADLAWADLVMTGGMLPQQPDTLALIDLAQAAGKPVCVGGPGPTSTPEVFRKADFLVLGEAEDVIEQFVAAFESGARRGEFIAPKFQADVSKSPVPRFDLLKFRDYLYVGVQFSRGCPFRCEFCDIIELYGNVPRAKTTEQMLRELDTLYAMNYRGHVDFVDDNLIGNKKALKRFLPALIAWQKEKNYPFRFSTEASINLADDAELLLMMREAKFFAVFVGIESPDPDTLVQMQKKQNTRRSLGDSVRKIYESGMFVLAGFIIGFDEEREQVSKGMIDCIEDTSIAVCMAGLLTALPNTQLTRRLEREGRLAGDFDFAADASGDQCTQGLNFTTLRPRRDVLRDYRDVLASIYQPAAFFRRARTMGLALNRPSLGRKKSSVRARWRAAMVDMSMLLRLTARLAMVDPQSLPHFAQTFVTCARKNPAALEYVMFNVAMFLHLRPFSKFVIRDLDKKMRELDAGPAGASIRINAPGERVAA